MDDFSDKEDLGEVKILGGETIQALRFTGTQELPENLPWDGETGAKHREGGAHPLADQRCQGGQGCCGRLLGRSL